MPYRAHHSLGMPSVMVLPELVKALTYK
jgi:hypothetical protein